MTEIQKAWDALRKSPLSPAILPIANKEALFAPNSKLKTIGKVPSLYNSKGEIIGYADWPNKVPTEGQLALWSSDPRLGIGINAKYLRAFDVDIDDAKFVKTLVDEVFKPGIGDFPIRTRDNANRILIPFFYEKPLAKCVYSFKEGGAVELLADGQQWVAFGRHPSGVDYRWVGDILKAPTLNDKQLKQINTMLTMVFGASVAEDTSTERQKGELIDTNIDKDTEDFIRQSEYFIDETSDRIIVRCPNHAQHTNPDDDQAVWFKAGTNGYELGHFKCLHAHCQEISTEKFLSMIGYQLCRVEDFRPIRWGEDPQSWQELKKSFSKNKAGAIVASIHSVASALMYDQSLDIQIFYDEFSGKLLIERGANPAVLLTEEQESELARVLESRSPDGFTSIKSDIMNRALQVLKLYRRRDLVKEWITGLAWDGIPRVDRFLADYCNVDDTEAAKRLSRYMWQALAGRASTSEGVKADVMPVLVGKQALRKTSAVRALVPGKGLYQTFRFDINTNDIYRKLMMCLIAEASELAGANRVSLEELKDLLSADMVSFVDKYKSIPTTFNLRCLIIGTTNTDDFLRDDENRRFAPVYVNSVIDTKKIEKNRDQLWAEGLYLYRKFGVQQAEVEEAFKPINEGYRESEPWLEKVDKFLRENYGVEDYKPNGELPDRVRLTAVEILESVILKPAKEIKKQDVQRINKVFRRLGYDVKRARRDGRFIDNYVFVEKTKTES